MIDFNLQRALDGAPLICRDGSLVLDWMKPVDGNTSTFPIAAQIKRQFNDEIVTLEYDLRGRFDLGNESQHPHDLMLDITEQQVEVHFYKNTIKGDILTITNPNVPLPKEFKYITSKTITIEL
jgi:hypothetical protein